MIVVDTSAVVAILLAEDEGAAFRARIAEAGGALVSAASAVELAAVSGRDDALFDAARSFLNEPYVAVEPVDAQQAVIASDAYRRFGKGRKMVGPPRGTQSSGTCSPTPWLERGGCRCCSRATTSRRPMSSVSRREPPRCRPAAGGGPPVIIDETVTVMRAGRRRAGAGSTPIPARTPCASCWRPTPCARASTSRPTARTCSTSTCRGTPAASSSATAASTASRSPRPRCAATTSCCRSAPRTACSRCSFARPRPSSGSLAASRR